MASEQELVDRLTTLSPPPPPITLTNEYDGINATQNVGCFVAGAGMSMTLCMHVHVYIPVLCIHVHVCTHRDLHVHVSPFKYAKCIHSIYF